MGAMTKTCPVCKGAGTADGVRACPICRGDGELPKGFPNFYHYVFGPLLVTARGGVFQKQIANEAAFDAVQILGRVIQGDSRFIQLSLADQSTGPASQFSSDPVDFDLFCGDGKLPFTLVEPFLWGKQTQLKLSASLITVPGQVQLIGNGGGVAQTFTAQLLGGLYPILPGSIVVTDLPGIIVGVDDGVGGIAGAGIVGTIDYASGVISVTYTVAPALGTVITVTGPAAQPNPNPSNLAAVPGFQLGLAQATIEATLFGFLMIEKAGTGATQPSPGR